MRRPPGGTRAPTPLRGPRTPAVVLAYLAAIVLANLLVTRFGPWALPLTALGLIPFDLVARDYLQDQWPGPARWKIGALIATGGAASWALNHQSARIALASTTAFVAAASIDTLAYTVLGRWTRLRRILTSTAASALTDSLLFPAIAFGAWLPGVVASQATMKWLGGYAWALAFRRAFPGWWHRPRLRHHDHG